jgi:hypothetical protein
MLWRDAELGNTYHGNNWASQIKEILYNHSLM